MKKILTASLAALLLAGCSASAPAEAEPETKEDTAAETEKAEEPAVPADDKVVVRTYTLENGTGTDIEELHVYQSKGKNLAEGGMKPGDQIQVDVSGYYLHTPNETLWTVESTAGGNTYAIRTLHRDISKLPGSRHDAGFCLFSAAVSVELIFKIEYNF